MFAAYGIMNIQRLQKGIIIENGVMLYEFYR